MTSSPNNIFPPLETNEDHQDMPFLTSPISQTSLCSSSSSSSVIRPTAVYPSQNHGRYHIELLKPYQESLEVDDQYGGSRDHQILSPPSLSTLESGSEYGLKLSISEGDQIKEESRTSEKGAVSWMSSKMRLMKKMINSDTEKPLRSSKSWFQDQMQSFNDGVGDPSSAMIRTCSDCNTTRTPLWRSGPKGPKSLCNACGIRQRKARRAMAAAAASNGSTGVTTDTSLSKAHCSKKKTGKGHTAQQKKQCKLMIKRKNLSFEDFVLNLSNNLSLHRVISQDETEAAILLMALSYGLVSN